MLQYGSILSLPVQYEVISDFLTIFNIYLLFVYCGAVTLLIKSPVMIYICVDAFLGFWSCIQTRIIQQNFNFYIYIYILEIGAYLTSFDLLI